MAKRKIRVAILIGSSSDSTSISPCKFVLKDAEVPHEVLTMSAHRDPNKVAKFAKNARKNGYKVIIAAAGLTNALAGACAAHSDLPVIALPLTSAASTLGGIDALLSSVQMPSGVPVASVGINNAKNAAYMAIRILSV